MSGGRQCQRSTAAELTRFAAELLAAVGVARDEAAIVAASLVGANLRGHDSHGVMRLPQYIGFIEQGAISSWGGPEGRARDAGGRRLRRAMGPGAGPGAPAAGPLDPQGPGRWGSPSARPGTAGTSAGWASTPSGPRSLGLLLLATVNNGGAVQRVAPPGGLEPRLSTNPFCAGVPTTDPDAPIVVDFGTSVVAEGKVRDYFISGRPVPEGWLLDHQGRPTTDPSVLYEPPKGTILPLGGAQSYKGFGLGLILDLWAGGLSGGGCSQTDRAAGRRQQRLLPGARSRPAWRAAISS